MPVVKHLCQYHVKISVDAVFTVVGRCHASRTLAPRGQTLVCLLPFTIEGIVYVSLVLIRAFCVKGGSVVWSQRKVLLDSPDEIRV